MGGQGAGCTRGEMGSTIDPSATSSVILPHWGPMPTGRVKSSALAKGQEGGGRSRSEGQVVPKVHSHSRKGSSPGPRQSELLNQQDPQYASLLALMG